MSELSQDTKNLVHALFKTREAIEVCALLERDCGTEALSCEGWTPTQMERLRFAVLRLAKDGTMTLESAINLAKTDWRDLLMAAHFGNDLDAHKTWARKNAN